MKENNINNDNQNILKIRDDLDLLKLNYNKSDSKFIITSSKSQLDWCKDNKCTKNELRARVEPWLNSLFQSEHLSLLIGSGLTSAIQCKTCGKCNNGMGTDYDFSVFSEEINLAAESSAKRMGRGDANFEDKIRVANDVIRGLTVFKYNNELKISQKLDKLKLELHDILKRFTDNISKIEHLIASSKSKDREDAFNLLVLFLMSFASRSGTKDRLNIFTTNYDRLIEAAADIAGLRLIDRFVGTLSPIFRSSRIDIDMHYNPPGIRGEPRFLEGVARFTKLHGSLDWISDGEEIIKIGLPFGAKSIAPFLENARIENDYSRLMIYPNSTKDRETSEYPYVELFRDLASALCQPNTTLVTYGYSFGDDHINRVIKDMLTIPSTHLVVIDYSDSTGRIMDKYNSWGRKSQMSLLIGKDIANLDDLVNYYLPKPSIDRASIKMAEILKHRFSSSSNLSDITNEIDSNNDSEGC